MDNTKNPFATYDEQGNEINPLTGKPIASQVQSMFAPQSSPQPMDPKVQDYLSSKFDLGEYNDDARKKLQEDSKLSFGDKAGAALAAIGAGFMGKDAASAGMNKLNAAKSEKRQALEDFDKGRSNKIQEFDLNRKATMQGREDEQYKQDQEKLAREKDPNSPESKMAQDLAKSMGYNGDVAGITADKFKQFSPALEKMYTIAEAKKDKSLDRQLKQQEIDIKKQEAAAKASPLGKLSEGQKAVDKDYAKDYNEWTSTGRSTLDKNLTSLKEARDALKADSSLTGGLTGVFGDRLTADRVLKQRQKVQSAVQNSLKATLGSQFTEKEGERILKNAYNEAASPETNIESLNALITQLESQKQVNDQKAGYYEKSGSLQGYKSSPSQQSSGYPKQVRKGNQVATVKSAEEEAEAKQEGFQ